MRRQWLAGLTFHQSCTARSIRVSRIAICRLCRAASKSRLDKVARLLGALLDSGVQDLGLGGVGVLGDFLLNPTPHLLFLVKLHRIRTERAADRTTVSVRRPLTTAAWIGARPHEDTARPRPCAHSCWMPLLCQLGKLRKLPVPRFLCLVGRLTSPGPSNTDLAAA